MSFDPPLLADAYLDVLPCRVRSRIVTDGSSCHIWTGGMSGRTLGAGVACIDGASQFVHRAVWRLNKGPLASSEIVVRTCRNPRCVRLDHLQATTTSAWLLAIRHGHDLAA